MKQGLFKISSNEPAAAGIYRMRLEGDAGAISTPGQFINIRLAGYYTRRPISVCDSDESSVTIFYKIVGDGTEAMKNLRPGAVMDVLTGLGNGFDTEKSGVSPLLIGGGIGCAPLYKLCKTLCAQGKKPSVILAFNSRDDMILTEEFRALGVELIIATADGSCGVKGFAADAMKGLDYTYFYACGPSAMFASVNAAARTSGQFSYEARMGCGFGACMSCSCKTRFGSKRVCKDGPVFEREEILW